MRPRANPEEGLRSGVTEAAEKLGRSADERASLRRRIVVSDPSEVAFALECDLPATKTATLLIVDQFEELFAQTPDALCPPFVKMLLALANSGRDIRVLLTVRADYFNLLSEIRDPAGNEIVGADGRTLFARLTADGRAAILPLKRISEAGLREVVCEPLRLSGDADKSAQEALLQAVLREISDQPSDLPLLQVALRATWRQQKATGCGLLEAYESVGGVLGALAREAEKVRNARLSSEDQARLESIFVRLVRLGDTSGATRRTATLDEFDPPRRALLRLLGDDEHGRLIVVSETSAEIAHEALITQWPWLQSRLRDEARDVRRLDRLMSKSDEWNQAPAERKEGYLAVGAERELFDKLAGQHSDWLSGIDRAFVGASNAFHKLELDAKRAEEERKEHDRSTLRRGFNLLMAAAALLLLAVGITAWLFLRQAELRREADSAAAIAEKSKDEADAARKLAEAQRNQADGILANATDIVAKVQSQLDNNERFKANSLFRAGAEHGDVGSMRNLGLSYMDGLGVAQDYAIAHEWFEKAAGKGNQDAMRDLGMLYENGRGVSRDYAKAREWYEKAAEKGDASAMAYLGALYDGGRGVPRDYAKAREWFEKAADKGDPSAMVDLGAMYAGGQGVAQDYVKAREWYEKAAEKGDESAMAALGKLYRDGKGAPQDYAKAREWYEKAADKGDASAMFNLGLLYAKGQGVPEDYAKAREWYENAAGKGDVNAMTGLGALYADGRGAPQDYARAAEWFMKAADQGSAPAMLNLSALYANGRGVPQDDAKAREWLQKAADNGVMEARERLEELRIEESAATGRYSEAQQLEEALAHKIETRETEREGKPGGETAQALNSIAWYALLARDYGSALAAAERAHAILPADLIVDTNLAHALMLLGREKEAEALYLSHRGERLSKADSRLWESAVAEDFAALQKAGVTDPMMTDILKQLGVSQ
jgi:TPR repeat protein